MAVMYMYMYTYTYGNTTRQHTYTNTVLQVFGNTVLYACKPTATL